MHIVSSVALLGASLCPGASMEKPRNMKVRTSATEKKIYIFKKKKAQKKHVNTGGV